MGDWVAVVVIIGMSLAALIQLRVNWLNRNDRCAPTATQCAKAGAGHLYRHHSQSPVPFHGTCPR